MVEYHRCQYHGKYRSVEWHDWQCPKCQKELADFAGWRSGKKKTLGSAKGLVRRMGFKGI